MPPYGNYSPPNYSRRSFDGRADPQGRPDRPGSASEAQPEYPSPRGEFFSQDSPREAQGESPQRRGRQDKSRSSSPDRSRSSSRDSDEMEHRQRGKDVTDQQEKEWYKKKTVWATVASVATVVSFRCTFNCIQFGLYKI